MSLLHVNCFVFELQSSIGSSTKSFKSGYMHTFLLSWLIATVLPAKSDNDVFCLQIKLSGTNLSG